MTTGRLYLVLFGAPLLVMGIMGLVISGGDLHFTGFFLEAGLVAVGLIALLSLPFVRGANRWQERPLKALKGQIGGEIVSTLGGDRHLRLPEPDGGATLLFWTTTAETAGDEGPGQPWTCVGRQWPGRAGPAVEVRFRPGQPPETRWSNRWWEELGRGAPPDPLADPGTRQAALALAGIFDKWESRLRVDGEIVAFALPGHVSDPAGLLAFVFAARPVLAGTGGGAPRS